MLFRVCLLCLLSLVLSFSAGAGTVHRVHFSNPGKVLVWQDGEFAGQGADVSIQSAGAVIQDAWRGAGTLEPVSAATTANPNEIRLKVASNTGFMIEALDGQTAETVSVVVTAVGPNAALNTAGSALNSPVLFTQTTKTALRRGLPQSQALKLTIRWHGDPPALRIRAAAF